MANLSKKMRAKGAMATRRLGRRCLVQSRPRGRRKGGKVGPQELSAGRRGGANFAASTHRRLRDGDM